GRWRTFWITGGEWLFRRVGRRGEAPLDPPYLNGPEKHSVKVAVIGTGYVGLVTGTCLAESGNDVVCVDNNPAKIQTLNEGRIPIYEPGLLELVQQNRRFGRLTFTTDLVSAVRAARLIFVAVGTPQSDT